MGEVFGVVGRGLHSSTFLLNLSALCGIGVSIGAVWGCFGGSSGCWRMSRVCLVSETAHVKLETGRVLAPGGGLGSARREGGG
jgi:hypothetical protein